MRKLSAHARLKMSRVVTERWRARARMLQATNRLPGTPSRKTMPRIRAPMAVEKSLLTRLASSKFLVDMLRLWFVVKESIRSITAMVCRPIFVFFLRVRDRITLNMLLGNPQSVPREVGLLNRQVAQQTYWLTFKIKKHISSHFFKFPPLSWQHVPAAQFAPSCQLK